MTIYQTIRRDVLLIHGMEGAMSKSTKKTFALAGETIHTVDDFYDQVTQVLCAGWSGFGRNLDAFNDVLRGGFGAFEPGEEIRIEWRRFHQGGRFREKKDLLDILEEAENVDFVKR